MDLLNEITQHFFADIEVGNHSVFQRTHGPNVAWSTSHHALGLVPDGDRLAIGNVKGNHRRLVQDNALTAHIYQRVGSTQIDSNIICHELIETK